MAKLHHRDHGPRVPFAKLFLLGLFLVGLVLIVLQALYNSGNYLRAWLTPVEHPRAYKFSALDSALRQCVKGRLVDYQFLKDSGSLEPALRELSHTSASQMTDPAERLSYWLNTYNLLVLKSVVDNYPINSVREITRPMSLHKFVIGGQTYSIEDVKNLELGALQNQFDPRSVFLMCGGSRGYPALLDHALQAESLQEDMDKSTYDFINQRQNVYFDPDSNTFYLSHLFKWYEEPLSKVFNSPAAMVNAYLPSEKQVAIDDPRVKIRYLESFDWRLNDTVQAKSSTSGPTP